MLRLSYQVCGILLLSIFLYTVQCSPPCDREDERCREQLMHPKLTSSGTKFRFTGSGEYSTEYWRTIGKDFVKSKINEKPNKNKAKNVIMFLGDGMGVTTLAAARNLIGGEEQYLSFEQFPYTGLSKTYSVSHMVAESSGTATAYLCGVKTNSGTLGVNAKLPRGTCQNTENSESQVNSIAKWALDAGKAAGIVTTTRITHASPAGAYAHITERDWEYNAAVEKDCGKNSGINDIAYQLINGEVGSKLSIIFGGGRRNFLNGTNGLRTDGLNLIKSFQNMDVNNLYLKTRDELLQADLSKAKRVMGLFAKSHLKYHLEKVESDNQPSLTEMTLKAIEKLSLDPEGYFLFVEGGRIDTAHHDNTARLALDETIELSNAVKAALNATSLEDTLIVVTADHSHGFSYAGYPDRGNDIFGTSHIKANDGKEYMTVSYANGPGFNTFVDSATGMRLDPTKVDVSKANAKFPSTFHSGSAAHGGEDVPVFAIGPQSDLFTGVFEQNIIPHAMAYASCIGSGLKMCKN